MPPFDTGHSRPAWEAGLGADYARSAPESWRRAGTAYGYRGPGTDLGEDIRRGLVNRSGARGWTRAEPPGSASDGDLHHGRWAEPLREGWSGLLRTGRSYFRDP